MRFGPEVPVRTIEVTDPTIEAIPQAEREVIGAKVSYRLAQQPGSYMVLKYVRPVVKRRGSETMLTAPAPVNVLERSGADVSFLGAMLIDKFCWHLPLYRQHQRLLNAGITLSRSTVVYWTSRAIDLLAPLADAQSAHVLASGVLAMDETSLKAGRKAKGKMRTGWLWPVYGDAEEGVFHYAPSRAHRPVHEFLGPYRGTLLSDGYEAYASCAAQRPGEVTHALCWAHTRRYFAVKVSGAWDEHSRGDERSRIGARAGSRRLETGSDCGRPRNVARCRRRSSTSESQALAVGAGSIKP